MDHDAVELSDQKTGSRIIPFLLVIAVCLVTGLALGSWTGGKTASPAEPKQAPLNLVYLGYDSFRTPAELSSVWVLMLDGNGGAEFRGISPALIITTAVGHPAVLRDFLSDPFGASARIPQIPCIPQPAIVVAIDRDGFSTVVNRTGGVQIDGNYLRGDDLVAFLSQGGPDPIAGLRQELRVVKSMFAAGPCPSESSLAGLDPEHLLSTLAPDALVAECRKRGPYLQGSVIFRIMDDAIPWQLPDGSIGLLPAE
ncbi:MAG: hypothetical protein JW748_07420 [Anaerolineales bacterium]|nr:hypothetical protein [Anaerolineales bacterium]